MMFLSSYSALLSKDLPSNLKNIKVLIILGPTGTGKSEVAVAVGLSLKKSEIVSADSMLVYKDMNIGTAKPESALQAKLPHHLIDIVDPCDNFSAALYQKLARQTIVQIHERGNLPILVGGTGLYIRAAVDNLAFPAGELNSETRRRLAALAQENYQQLWQTLAAKDPLAAEKIPPENTRRVIRALEIMELTGRPFSYWQQNWQKREAIYNCFFVGLNMPREKLYEKLDKRVEQMLKHGLVEEVKQLKKKHILSATAKQALGYKEILAYLDGNLSLEEAVDLIKKRTRHYAKRQLTWFKADPRINWIKVTGLTTEQIKEAILTLVKNKQFIVSL